ncbi:alpha/beta hydrolase [Roseisolibacter sp. H3M3-2]|uniref:alpha/beta fold hydrolase n=1 Tax=Roseisolibacter sp. H3M3-2 TaxID=3031323 RepID=UPI0023DAFC1B|nr:alpha/beta hydrolase [Roseisolibacter sp. H3M3-2]MDF1501554.1 alpha/beta hydrolase [Roseisolibacter sp. H3M3-2]
MPASVLERHHVQVAGRGPRTLVFAHGFGCNQRMWRFVAPAFERDFRVVRFDLAGAGAARRAWDPVRHATLDGYATDLLAILDALDLRDATVVGHSVSATVAMLAAIRSSRRIGRLVMVGPSPCYADDPPGYVGGFARADLEALLDLMERNYRAWVEALAPTIVGTDETGTAIEARTLELRDSILATDPAVIRAFARATFLEDHRAAVPHLPVPALVVQCTDDAIAPEQVGRWLHARLPRATYHQLAAAGHCPHLTHPEELVAAIRRHLAPRVVVAPPAYRSAPRPGVFVS